MKFVIAGILNQIKFRLTAVTPSDGTSKSNKLYEGKVTAIALEEIQKASIKIKSELDCFHVRTGVLDKFDNGGTPGYRYINIKKVQGEFFNLVRQRVAEWAPDFFGKLSNPKFKGEKFRLMEGLAILNPENYQMVKRVFVKIEELEISQKEKEGIFNRIAAGYKENNQTQVVLADIWALSGLLEFFQDELKFSDSQLFQVINIFYDQPSDERSVEEVVARVHGIFCNDDVKVSESIEEILRSEFKSDLFQARLEAIKIAILIEKAGVICNASGELIGGELRKAYLKMKEKGVFEHAPEDGASVLTIYSYWGDQKEIPSKFLEEYEDLINGNLVNGLLDIKQLLRHYFNRRAEQTIEECHRRIVSGIYAFGGMVLQAALFMDEEYQPPVKPVIFQSEELLLAMLHLSETVVPISGNCFELKDLVTKIVEKYASKPKFIRKIATVLGTVATNHPKWSMAELDQEELDDLTSSLAYCVRNKSIWDSIKVDKTDYFDEDGKSGKDFYFEFKAMLFVHSLKDNGCRDIARAFFVNELIVLKMNPKDWTKIIQDIEIANKAGISEILNLEWIHNVFHGQRLFEYILYEILDLGVWWDEEEFIGNYSEYFAGMLPFLNRSNWYLSENFADGTIFYKELIEKNRLAHFLGPFLDEVFTVDFDEVVDLYFSMPGEYWGEYIAYRRSVDSGKPQRDMPLAMGMLIQSHPDARSYVAARLVSKFRAGHDRLGYLYRILDCIDVLQLPLDDDLLNILSHVQKTKGNKGYRLYAKNKRYEACTGNVEARKGLFIIRDAMYEVNFNYAEIRAYEASLMVQLPQRVSVSAWLEIVEDTILYMNNNPELHKEALEFTVGMVTEDHPEISWEDIRNGLRNKAIANLLHVVGSVSEMQKKFISCVDYLISLSTERSDEKPLSDRDEGVIRLGALLQACLTGKEWGIEQFYKGIPKEFQLSRMMGSATENRAKAMLMEYYQEKMSGLIESAAFQKSLIDLKDGAEIYEPLHQAKQLKNVLGPIIGLRHKVVFDEFACVVYDDIRRGYKEIFEVFSERYLVSEFIHRARAELNERILRNEIENHYMRFEALRPEGVSVEDFWVYTDEDDEAGRPPLLSLLGCLHLFAGAGIVQSKKWDPDANDRKIKGSPGKNSPSKRVKVG